MNENKFGEPWRKEPVEACDNPIFDLVTNNCPREDVSNAYYETHRKDIVCLNHDLLDRAIACVNALASLDTKEVLEGFVAMKILSKHFNCIQGTIIELKKEVDGQTVYAVRNEYNMVEAILSAARELNLPELEILKRLT